MPSDPQRAAAHACVVLCEKTPLTFSHPLARRMTPMQKALLEVVHRMRSSAADVFARAMVDGGCAVFFATALGEFSSNLGMLEGLRKGELPLSPTAFQHSVHNCPAGYLSIVFGLKNPMTTLCGGAQSSWKALILASSHVRRETESTRRQAFAFVLVADEIPKASADAFARGSLLGADEGAPVARAEALLLASEPAEAAPPGIYLERMPAVSLRSDARAGSPVEGLPVWPWILGPASDIVTGSVQVDALETRPRWISRT